MNEFNPEELHMNNDKPANRQNKILSADDFQLGNGGEVHQIVGGDHSQLTTNQGVGISDNQNSLKVNPCGPTLLEDFILREKPRRPSGG